MIDYVNISEWRCVRSVQINVTHMMLYKCYIIYHAFKFSHDLLQKCCIKDFFLFVLFTTITMSVGEIPHCKVRLHSSIIQTATSNKLLKNQNIVSDSTETARCWQNTYEVL